MLVLLLLLFCRRKVPCLVCFWCWSVLWCKSGLWCWPVLTLPVFWCLPVLQCGGMATGVTPKDVGTRSVIGTSSFCRELLIETNQVWRRWYALSYDDCQLCKELFTPWIDQASSFLRFSTHTTPQSLQINTTRSMKLRATNTQSNKNTVKVNCRKCYNVYGLKPLCKCFYTSILQLHNSHTANSGKFLLLLGYYCCYCYY